MVKFPCGCEIDPNHFDPYDIRLDCPEVFNMLARGLTRGVWQLESNLGKTYTQRLKPTSIQDLSALVALLRPAVLEAYDENGVNMVQKYCNRKNGLEETTYLHPSLEPILKNNFGVICYQELAMKICQELAGFSESEADGLRKAMGKKLPEEMAKVKTLFLEKAKTVGILDNESAEQLFEQIQASQRYSFNASHATLYGTYSYITAYMKYHFTLEFFCSYLSFASEKIDPALEKHELVNEAKLFNVEILPPDFRWQQSNFHIKDEKIYFGMSNVKGVGASKIKKLLRICKEAPQDVTSMQWFDLLVYVLSQVDTTTVENLILVGAFDYLRIPRMKMHYEYGIWNRLTDKEKEWISAFSTEDNLLSVIRSAARPKKDGGACANKNRVSELEDLIKILEQPPFPLKDSTGKIALDEQRLLGISLTAHETDSSAALASCSCKEYLAGFTGNIALGVSITRVSECKTKKGKNPGQLMAFMTVEDLSCALDCLVCFPETYTEFKSLLVPNNTVLIHGNRSKDNSLIVQKVTQI